ncbi:hypothetical protein DFJ58DRAFT_729290 [Suillus subalutaceus]|uniref:uncharacterized protein n=1 Tax=Suillus subalutaceus TaxID=48586 RepID=UPI001B86D0DF|nr:uncharacterized protein DFJ58DRAFT_729290 [Suillus subalutaceus]KAG1850196.1 hypothetical protein DFJ58DRAFT_729290 [Suillus subalutaceus]
MSCSYRLLTCLLTDIDHAQALMEASSVHQGPRFKDGQILGHLEPLHAHLLVTFARALKCLTSLSPVPPQHLLIRVRDERGIGGLRCPGRDLVVAWDENVGPVL